MNRWKKLYTVYDNKTDFPVIVDGTSEECARAMGITLSTFYKFISYKKTDKWFIIFEGKR